MSEANSHSDPAKSFAWAELHHLQQSCCPYRAPSAHKGKFYSMLTSIWMLNHLKYQRNQHFKDFFFPINVKCLFIFSITLQIMHSLIGPGNCFIFFYPSFLFVSSLVIQKNECILVLHCVCLNSSCILVLLVAYYINNIIVCILGIETCSLLPVCHSSLQH